MTLRSPGIPLASFITRLIWLCLLPLVLLAAWLAADRIAGMEAETDQTAGNLTKNLATHIDHFLDARIRALQLLAGSPHAGDAASRASFYQQAQRFQQTFDGHVVLADRNLQMLFNTRVPYGTPLPKLPQPPQGAVAPQVLETRRPAVSNLVTGVTAPVQLVALVVPVMTEGDISHLLVASFETTVFQQQFDHINLPAHWSLELLDGQGAPIARHGKFPSLPEVANEPPHRFQAPSTRSKWLVQISIPHADFHAAIFGTEAALLAALLAATFAGWFGGNWASRRLQAAVNTLGATSPASASTTHIIELTAASERLATTLAQLEGSRASAERFREALDHVDAHIYMKDQESRYMYANQRALDYFGCSAMELIGAPDDRFFPPATVAHLHESDRRVLAGEHVAEETEVIRSDGKRDFYWDVKSPIYLDDGQRTIWGICGISTDITVQKLLEKNLSFLTLRSESLLALPTLAETLNETDFMQRGMEMVEDLTGSCIAFIHFVNPDQESIELITWSRRTLERYCNAIFDRHYSVSEAGIWAEALRKKRPVVFNDYANAPEQRGLPAGHSVLERLISLPVIEQGQVVMLAGIGNKASDYSEQDVETLQIIANEIWRLVQRTRNQRQIEYFNRVIERSLNEIYTVDATTLRFVDVNRGACNNLGYTLDEMRHLTPLDINPEFSSAVLEQLLEPLRMGSQQIVHFITPHRRKDGTTYMAELHIEMTDDASPLFMAVVKDITIRQRMEQDLHQLAQAVEQSSESIFIVDLDGRFQYVNAAFLQATGYTRDEVIGQNPRILKSGETEQATYTALWDALTHGMPWEGEMINKRKDGGIYIDHARIAPIRQPDGQVTHYLAINQDITEQRAAELELRQALQVVEASPVVSFRWHAAENWPVEYVSQNVSRWGYRAEDLRAGRPPFSAIVHPDDLPQIALEVARHAAAGTSNYVQTYRVRAADGHYFWVEDHTRVIRDAAGAEIAYEAVVTDIDTKKRYEDDLAHNLSQQRALNAKLEEAQNQLLQSEKMASIGQLAAGVAHELNNPIGFVNSNLGSLEKYLRDLFAITEAYAAAATSVGVPCPQLDQVQTLKHELDYDYLRSDIFQLMDESKDGLSRVARIVRDLKDFSRAGEAEWQLADLHQGLNSTLNIVWNDLKYKCTVKKEYGVLPPVWCVPSQLNQVFMNLLVNAGHAIHEKGEITIRTGQEGDQVFISIADNGAGIAPDHLTRIFEPFFTTKPVGQGTGLGLSLSYSIVQKHRGRFDVQSTVGQGTRFTIWLPIERPAVSQPEGHAND